MKQIVDTPNGGRCDSPADADRHPRSSPKRPGRLRISRNGKLEPSPVKGLPQVYAVQLVGLMDVALHPKFSENHLLYLTYNKPGQNKQVATAPARGRLDGDALTDVRDIFVADFLLYDGTSKHARARR